MVKSSSPCCVSSRCFSDKSENMPPPNQQIVQYEVAIAGDILPLVSNSEDTKAQKVNEDKKKPACGGGKRKRTTKKETEKQSAPRAKIARATKRNLLS